MPCHPAETYSDPLVNPRVSFQQYLLYAFQYLINAFNRPLPLVTLHFNYCISSFGQFCFHLSVLLYRLHLQLKPDLTVGGRLQLHVGSLHSKRFRASSSRKLGREQIFFAPALTFGL